MEALPRSQSNPPHPLEANPPSQPEVNPPSPPEASPPSLLEVNQAEEHHLPICARSASRRHSASKPDAGSSMELSGRDPRRNVTKEPLNALFASRIRNVPHRLLPLMEALPRPEANQPEASQPEASQLHPNQRDPNPLDHNQRDVNQDRPSATTPPI